MKTKHVHEIKKGPKVYVYAVNSDLYMFRITSVHLIVFREPEKM